MFKKGKVTLRIVYVDSRLLLYYVQFMSSFFSVLRPSDAALAAVASNNVVSINKVRTIVVL